MDNYRALPFDCQLWVEIQLVFAIQMIEDNEGLLTFQVIDNVKWLNCSEG